MGCYKVAWGGASGEEDLYLMPRTQQQQQQPSRILRTKKAQANFSSGLVAIFSYQDICRHMAQRDLPSVQSGVLPNEVLSEVNIYLNHRKKKLKISLRPIHDLILPPKTC